MDPQTEMPSARARTTALVDVHRRRGAHFIDFAGWTMPVRYTSEVAEHHAVRRAAGLFDLSHMGEIEVRGPGAGAALDFAVVSKPSAMGVGRARYSMICDEQGGILDDLVIYRLAEDRYMVVANATNAATVSRALTERAAGHDATVRDATNDWVLIAVQGPSAARILRHVTEAGLDELKYYTIAAADLLGVEVLLARTGYTGEDGFEIYSHPRDAERIWTGVSDAGAAHGLVPAGLACRDTLRLEAGMPLYGDELSQQVTPYETGLGRIVDFTKEGGFVGEKALASQRDEGAARSLVGLLSRSRRSPRSGYPVIDPATGGHIGEVTSGAPSPTLGHPIAIASLSVDFDKPGAEVFVDVRGAREPAQVVALPFYRRPTT